MKDEEKKVNEAEEVKTEENGIELSGDELAQVTGGVGPVVGELGLEVPGVVLDYSNSVYGP